LSRRSPFVRGLLQAVQLRHGATFVGSTVDDLLEVGAGVCHDFVHLGLILLGQQEIAARYVWVAMSRRTS
jgi:hypothetical protein